MWRLAVAAVAVAGLTYPASAQSKLEQGRKLYAIAETGPEYCPNIKRRWLVMGIIADTFDYRPGDDWPGLRAERQPDYYTSRTRSGRGLL